MIRRSFLQLFSMLPFANFGTPKGHPIWGKMGEWVPFKQCDVDDQQDLERRLEQEKVTQAGRRKAYNCLLAAGFTQLEAEQVRKDIAKYTPAVKEHEGRFEQSWKWFYQRRINEIWQAIMVTFRTDQDGFTILGVEPLEYKRGVFPYGSFYIEPTA